jgi:sugar transferase (PEP-CTERM/EpsH1 system associated)
MKILFACHRFPFPPNRGGKIRPFNMIRHLSQKHDIVVATVAHTQEEFDEGAGLREYCAEIYAEVIPEKVRWLQAVRALPSSTPSSVAYFSSAALRRKIKEVALKISFDAILVHCAFAAQYALGVPAKFCLMDFGDLDSGKWLDYSECRPFPLSWGYYFEGQKLRSYEQKVAASFEYCTLTTQGELEEFKKLNVDVPSAVIPNGIDTNYFRPRPDPQNGQVAVFVGRMDYFPNIDGAEHFARNVFPIIRQRMPDAKLRLVGSNPNDVVRNLASIPGVTVTGHVPDVRPYLSDATLTVAPLRLARGTQNKILESMAMGIPVVATSVAAKGVTAIPGSQLLVADEPEQFANAVLRIFESGNLRKSISDSALRQMEEAHSWPRSMQVLDNILDDVQGRDRQHDDLRSHVSPFNPASMT